VDRRLAHVRVGSDRLVVVTGRNHPWVEAGEQVDLDDMVAAALVGREPGSRTRDVLAAARAAHGLRLPESVVTLGSTEAIKSMLRRGGTAGVISEYAVAEDVRRGELVVVEVPGLELTRTLRAVWRSRVALGPDSAALIERARRPETN